MAVWFALFGLPLPIKPHPGEKENRKPRSDTSLCIAGVGVLDEQRGPLLYSVEARGARSIRHCASSFAVAIVSTIPFREQHAGTDDLRGHARAGGRVPG
jgi:hypothetical protein